MSRDFALLTPDGAAIFVPVPVEEVVTAIFDRPVATVKGQDAGGIRRVGRMTGHAIDGFCRSLAGLLHQGVAFDDKDLTDAWKVEVIIEAGGGPDRALFDATMGQRRRFAKVRLTATFKDQADIRPQGRLVIFDGEDVMGVVFQEILGEFALGEQGIGGDRLAGDIQRLKDRDDHPDLIGLLELISAVYGQGADFFWV